MLILIPILLLILFAIVINLLGRYKLSIGSTWLIAAGSVLFVWILLIVFRIVIPNGLSIPNWSPLGIGSDMLVFKLSSRTWVFAFLLVSLLIGVVFTDTVRLGRGNNLTTWTGSMLITAVGLLSIYSQTFLATIITWSIIDVVEFGILIKVISHPKVHFALVLEFAARILGTTLIAAALIFSQNTLTIGDISQYPSAIYVLLLLGATLRLGVLPIHVPLTANLPIRRSLGTVLRFVSPLCVFSFLSQVQPQTQYDVITNFFLAIATISGFYGAIKWLTARNELTGRPYWLLVFSGLFLASFLRGQVEGSIALSVIMIICGGFVFYHSYSLKIVRILSVFCMVGMVGLPFTPVASIWKGLIKFGHPLADLLMFFSMVMIFIGFFKHMTQKREQETNKEIWMKLFYTIGLGLLAITPWVMSIWSFNELKTSIWTAPAVCLGLVSILLWMMRSKLGQKIWAKVSLLPKMEAVKNVGRAIGVVLQFEWFYPLIRKIIDLVALVVRFFINLLEGDGGLLWEILFLALISSVLIGKIVP